MYENRFTMTQIGNELGVSRQRISQIIKYRGSAAYRSKKKLKQLGNLCKICNSESIDWHHKNGNHQDNRAENLMPICKKCHYEIHKGRKVDRLRGKWSQNYFECQKCETTTIPYMAHGLCQKCHYIENK